jgi:fructokinase
MATWLGRDRRGAAIRSHLVESRVSLLEGSDAAQRTSTAQATLDGAGHAQYIFDLEWVLPPVPAQVGPLVMHVGSMGATLEPGASAVLKLFQDNPPQATLTYDPNVRPAIMGGPSEARRPIEALVDVAQVVKVSDEDLDYLYPDRTAEDAASRWLERGPALVIVTRGSAGAFALTAGGSRVDAGTHAAAVVDPIGAGDAFMGGVIHGLWEANLLGRERREALLGICPVTVLDVLDLANRIAAMTVSRAGANPPWLNEL